MTGKVPRCVFIGVSAGCLASFCSGVPAWSQLDGVLRSQESPARLGIPGRSAQPVDTGFPEESSAEMDTGSAGQPATLEGDEGQVAREEQQSGEASVSSNESSGSAGKRDKPESSESKLKAQEADDAKTLEAQAFYSQDDSGPKPDPEYYFNTGVQLMRMGKYQAALDNLNKALKAAPRHYEASYAKALVYQLTGYDKFAAKRYMDILKHRPDMDKARVNLATLHRKHKHYRGAEDQLHAVIAHNFYSMEAHYNLANVFMDQKKLEDALKEYKICLKLQPGNAQVHNNIGVIFLEKKYFEEAVQEFRQASNLEPANRTYAENVALAQRLLAESKPRFTM